MSSKRGSTVKPTSAKPAATAAETRKSMELPLDQIDLYFNALRLTTALVRDQPATNPSLMPSVSAPATPAVPPPFDQSCASGVQQATSAVVSSPDAGAGCSSTFGAGAGSSGTVNTTSTSGTSSSGLSSGSSFGHQQSGARNNRVTIPPQVAAPLEAYRMAVTNLPIDEDAVRTTCHALYDAMMTAFPLDDIIINRLFGEMEGSEHLGGSSSIRNDFGHRFSSTDDMQTMQEILPGLWCGSYHPANNKATLKRHDITHVLSCIGTAGRFPGEFMYMSIPLNDNSDFNITPFLNRTFEFIENALIRHNGGVLVHCGAGISRAPTVTAAYLMRKLRITSTQAIQMVQAKRPYASPNAGFCRQLRAYGRQLKLAEPTDTPLEAASGDNMRQGREAALKALALQKKAEPGSAAAQRSQSDSMREKTDSSPGMIS